MLKIGQELVETTYDLCFGGENAIQISIDGEIGGNLPIPEDFKQQIEDATPKFVTVQMFSGHSRYADGKPHRVWGGEIIRKMIKDINTYRRPGLMGHLKPEDYDTEVPTPPVQWVVAREIAGENGAVGMEAKGYVFPDSRSSLIPRIRTGVYNAVSQYGQIAQQVVRKAIEGKEYIVKEVKDFSLESLDFTRQGRQGMANVAVLGISGESASMDPNVTNQLKEVMGEMTGEQLKEINPKLYDSIISLSDDKRAERNTELASENAVLKHQFKQFEELPKLLGCEMAQVPSKVGELITARQAEAKKHIDTRLSDLETKLGGESADASGKAFLNMLKQGLGDTSKFKSVEEADEKFKTAYESTKSILGELITDSGFFSETSGEGTTKKDSNKKSASGIRPELLRKRS